MHSKKPCFITLFLGITLLANMAFAGTGGREKNRDITQIYNMSFLLQANTGYTIETDNLSGGADTVLHVQDVDNGTFVDGNDDCTTRLPGCSSLRSWLQISPLPTTKAVKLIVRNYNSTSSTFTATLRITPSGGTPVTYSISFSSGYKRTFGSYRDGTHFLTVEEPGGLTDTIMLATSGYSWRGIKFNDDSGVDRMSWMHVPGACANNCHVIVAPYSTNPGGKATFIWDEDAHDAECDTDGMSNALESALGTNLCLNDTDDDGIADGAEVGGVDVSPSLLKLPLYGADPLVKDLFLEADWAQCVTPPNYCGGTPSNPDYYKLTSAKAMETAARYAPAVKLHIDTGEINTNPATWYTYGAWGGATRRVSTPQDTLCSWLEPVRVGYFHSGRLTSMYGSGQGSRPGQCFVSASNVDGIAHELGHNLNLGHGGGKSSLDVNCKPNYVSIMNYAISGVGFSSNQLGGIVLNPTSASEPIGLGTTDPQLTGHLTNNAFRYTFDSVTGAVDWNRDGQISPTPVRAGLTWGWDSCETPWFQADTAVSPNRHTQAFSRFFPGTGSARLYWFTRQESDGTVEYRYATNFPDSCPYPPDSSCKTNWSPPVSQNGTALTGSQGFGAPAATWFKQLWVHNLLLVYKGTDNRLRYQTTTNGSYWGTSAYVPGTVMTITGDPAAVQLADEAHVYAISNGSLYGWKVQTNGQWTGPTLQQWADGSTVQAAFGIGLANGHIPYHNNGNMIIAAIPRVMPQGEIDLAWRNTLDGRWNKISDDRWLAGKAVTQAQPGLAYVPFDSAMDPAVGRFYLTWNPSSSVALMTQSEGNDASPSATSRRLQFRQDAILLSNIWYIIKGNVALLHDLTYDQDWQLWGGQTFRKDADKPTEVRNLSFSPYTGGIFNSLLKDHDDYAVIRANLKCSFSGPCI